MLGRAARGDREARLHLVEDQHDAVAGGDRANLLEVARLGQHDAEVHHRRLHDHAGRRAALAREAFDPPLHRGGVVERHRDRQLGHGSGDARAVGQRGEVVAVADLVVGDPDRDHDGVVVAVVGAEDLHDRVAPGQPASDPDRVHGRLRAGVDETPAGEPEALLQLLGDDDRILSHRGEVRAERDALAHRRDDRRVGVALDHRAEAVVEVPVLVAVDVADPRALAVDEVDRPRVAQLVGGGDAAAERAARPAVHRRRAGGARVELGELALDQLVDTPALQLHGAANGHRVSFPAGEADPRSTASAGSLVVHAAGPAGIRRRRRPSVGATCAATRLSNSVGDWCIGNTVVSKTAASGSTPGSPVARRRPENRRFTGKTAPDRLPAGRPVRGPERP